MLNPKPKTVEYIKNVLEWQHEVIFTRSLPLRVVNTVYRICMNILYGIELYYGLFSFANDLQFVRFLDEGGKYISKDKNAQYLVKFFY